MRYAAQHLLGDPGTLEAQLLSPRQVVAKLVRAKRAVWHLLRKGDREPNLLTLPHYPCSNHELTP
jgi:hypothetical protein